MNSVDSILGMVATEAVEAGANHKPSEDEYEWDAPLESLTPAQLADNAVELIHAVASGTIELAELDGAAREEELVFFNQDKDRLKAIMTMLFERVSAQGAP